MAEIRVELEVAAGRLPEVCARCGEPATTAKWKTMTWYPPWCNILLLVGVLPAAIVMMILTKRASVKAPFCEQHSWHWLNRNLLMWGTFLLFALIGLVCFIVGVNTPRDIQDNVMPFVCIGEVVLLVAWLTIVVIAQGTAVRVKKITGEEIVLAGVCDEFVDAVEDMEREFRQRRSKARKYLKDDQEEDDEDEPRPRKKNPSTEVQADEPRPRKKRPAADDIEE